MFSALGEALTSFGKALGMLFGASDKDYRKQAEEYLKEIKKEEQWQVPMYPSGIDPVKQMDDYFKNMKFDNKHGWHVPVQNERKNK